MDILKNKKHGITLALVVMILVILVFIGFGVLSIGMHGRLFSIEQAQVIQARCAADAGLERAFKFLKVNKNGLGSQSFPLAYTETLESSDSSYSYQINELVSLRRYEIISVGTAGNSQRTVHGVIRGSSPFDFPVQVIDLLKAKKIDILSADNLLVKVLSRNPEAGSIIIENLGTIDGCVYLLEGGSIDYDPKKFDITEGTYFITPDELPQLEDLMLSPANWPAPAYLPPITASVSINSDATYTDVLFDRSTGTGKTLTITKPNTIIVITGDLDLGKNNNVINIASGASLTLYLAGTIISEDGKNGITINNSNDPEAFKLITPLTGDKNTLTLMNNTTFNGLIYAPNTDIEVWNNLTINGSITANSLVANNGATITYDVDLAVTESFVKLVIDRWWEN